MGEPVAGAQPAVPAGGPFGLQDLLNDAFAAFKAHFGVLLGAFVVLAIISGVAQKIPFGWLLVSPHLAAGFSVMMLKALRGETPQFSDLFQGFSYYVPLLLAGLFPFVLTLLGLLCLVVPGVVVGLMWAQTMFLLADDMREAAAGRLDKGALSAWGAMQRSAAFMDGHKLRFLGYGLVLGLIGLAGVVAVGLGVLVTLPFAMLAAASFYNRLTKTT